MAGLKTPPKKKKTAEKPGAVLIIFLVFFILVSIGLGVWGYYGYDGQDKLKTEAKNAAAAAKAEKLYSQYVLFLVRDLRLAAGLPLEPDEINQYSEDFKEFMNDAGKWKDEKTRDAFKKMLADLKTELGGHDGAKYSATYKDRVRQLAKDLAETRALVNKAVADKDLAEELFRKYHPEREKKYAELKADIKKGNDAALAASTARTKEMEEQIKRNEELDGQIRALNAKMQEDEEKFKRQIKKLNDELTVVAREKNTGAEAQPKAAGPQRIHALMLDISRGYPLWDNPLGKITRMDLENRQVYINLGSAQGVQPELTFNVFAPQKGRAYRELKGSVEVVRVLDANSSIARITSLYDSSGLEIVLNDPSRGRAQREAETALKEGDLLFNAFWGTRVAIAGNISVISGGSLSDSPAEQARSLDTLMRFLSRQGITVDAYLDPVEGQVKGAITSRTRYLILGDSLVAARAAEPAAAPLPKKEKEGDAEEKKDEKNDEEMKKEEQMKNEEMKKDPGARSANLSALAARMKADAADKGLFVISAENFLNVIGHRRARSANFAEPSGYRPSVIIADIIQGNNGSAPAPKAPEPKDEEKIEKEKMQ